MRKQFKIEIVCEGTLSSMFLGSAKLPIKEMENVLNRYGADGWEMQFMIIEKRRMLLLWAREAAVITFSKTYD